MINFIVLCCLTCHASLLFCFAPWWPMYVGQLRLCCQFFEERWQQQWPPQGPGRCYYSWLFWCESVCTCRLWCDFLLGCCIFLFVIYIFGPFNALHPTRMDYWTLCLCQRVICVLTFGDYQLVLWQGCFYMCFEVLFRHITCCWMDCSVGQVFGLTSSFLKEFCWLWTNYLHGVTH